MQNLRIVKIVILIVSGSLGATDVVPEGLVKVFRERVEQALKNEASRIEKIPPKKQFDCEGLAHFIKTGKSGCFLKMPEDKDVYLLNVDNIESNQHKPYHGYALYDLALVEAPGEKWSFTHFFVYIGTYQDKHLYLSKNGFGPVRLFYSFEEMLKADAFPHGWPGPRGNRTAALLKDAVIGEAVVFGPLDYEL